MKEEGLYPLKTEWIRRALFTLIKLNNILGFLPLHLVNTFNLILKEVMDLFHLQGAYIYTVERGELILTAFSDPENLLPDLHKDSSINSCGALRHGLPFISCRNKEYRLTCPNRRDLYQNLSYICIPLQTGREMNGVFSASLREPELSREEMDVLISIANQISMAIQRQRLFETLKRERTEMEEAYKEIRFLNERLSQKIEELQEARFRLLQAEKLASIGELSAGLCHEINNPLSIIQNRIECLRMEAEELGLPETILKDLEVIYLYAEKVSSIVKDLLIFSRPPVTEFVPVRLESVISHGVARLEEELKKRCDIEVLMEKDLPGLTGDPDRLEQVFINLLTNAIDAMPQGGKITMKRICLRTIPVF